MSNLSLFFISNQCIIIIIVTTTQHDTCVILQMWKRKRLERVEGDSPKTST